MRNIFKKELAVAVSENYKFYDTVYTVRLHGTTVPVFADHSGLYALVSRRFDTRSEAKKAYSQIRFTPERSRLLLEARKKHAVWRYISKTARPHLSNNVTGGKYYGKI